MAKVTYDDQFKLDVLNYYYEHGQNASEAARQFDITRASFYQWKRQENHLRARMKALDEVPDITSRITDAVDQKGMDLMNEIAQEVDQRIAQWERRFSGAEFERRKQAMANYLESLFWKHAEVAGQQKEIVEMKPGERITAMGKILDKIRTLQGEPSVIIEVRNKLLEDVIAVLARVAGREVVDAFVREIEKVEEAEIIE